MLVGGLAAGVVVNIGEFALNGLILQETWDEAMRSLGRPPVAGASIAWLALMSLALGVVTVWVYAILRPSSRTGREATVRAAFLCWLLAYVFGFGWSAALGVFSAAIYWATLPWSFLELLLGALAGVWLYRAR
ncbi:MAG TPA: hypothetical protein VFS43_19860 [Polyangiaceae bacterium]|nr:hypothetical protein [Polyangiaceae bacterium]